MPYEPYAKKNMEARAKAARERERAELRVATWQQMCDIKEQVIRGEISAEVGAAKSFAIGQNYIEHVKKMGGQT